MASYATLQEAQAYFDERLHETAWSQSNPNDRPKALLAAARIIDTLAYKGTKNTVYVLLLANPDATCAEIREAEAAQENEFPRGADTVVVDAIKRASYEIAYALLDGVDPDLELENLAVTSQGVGSVRSTYSRNQEPQEHLINGVPSATAWRLLKPFLRDDNAIRLSRVS